MRFRILWLENLRISSVTMASRLHSANTLEEGMTQVNKGAGAAARKRELEERVAATGLQFHFTRSLACFCFPTEASRARVEALRRKMSNQALPCEPEAPPAGLMFTKVAAC